MSTCISITKDALLMEHTFSLIFAEMV